MSTDQRVSDPRDAGYAREGVAVGGTTEPRDGRQLRVRGPEALRPRRAVTGVLEHAGHGVAVLEADRGGLRRQAAGACAATASADRAVVWMPCDSRPADTRQRPTELRGFLDRVATGAEVLRVLVRVVVARVPLQRER